MYIHIFHTCNENAFEKIKAQLEKEGLVETKENDIYEDEYKTSFDNYFDTGIIKAISNRKLKIKLPNRDGEYYIYNITDIQQKLYINGRLIKSGDISKYLYKYRSQLDIEDEIILELMKVINIMEEENYSIQDIQNSDNFEELLIEWDCGILTSLEPELVQNLITSYYFTPLYIVELLKKHSKNELLEYNIIKLLLKYSKNESDDEELI